MKNDLSKRQMDTIMEALNHMVSDGPWESSPFLREIGKKIANVRDDFLPPATREAQNELNNKILDGGASEVGENQYQEIYIALYSADGAKMSSWEHILSNLPRQMIARSIYTTEADVKNWISTKINKVNEAYVVLKIDKSFILRIDDNKTSFDKLGQPLMVLKDRTITLDSIVRFVHSRGVYHFKNGRLIKTDIVS